MFDDQQKSAATKELVDFLNINIEHYIGQVPSAKILYSLEGLAEYFATTKYDCCVEDFAPKLISVLEKIKETNGSSGYDLSHPSCPWYANGLQRSVMRNHGINLDFLELLDAEEE